MLFLGVAFMTCCTSHFIKTKDSTTHFPRKHKAGMDWAPGGAESGGLLVARSIFFQKVSAIISVSFRQRKLVTKNEELNEWRCFQNMTVFPFNFSVFCYNFRPGGDARGPCTKKAGTRLPQSASTLAASTRTIGEHLDQL